MDTNSPSITNGSSSSVCIVDDDESILRSLSRLLESTGRQVRSYHCAMDFMQCQDAHGSDCVVLDMQLPDITGLQLHQWMHDKGLRQPVLFLTGYGDIAQSVQAMKLGASDFLVKPVDESDLLRAVDQAIQQFSAVKHVHVLRQAIRMRHQQLTSREREVMEHVIQGRLNKQIAWDLGISLKTVKVHRARAMEKMQADSVAELVHYCELAEIYVSTVKMH